MLFSPQMPKYITHCNMLRTKYINRQNHANANKILRFALFALTLQLISKTGCLNCLHTQYRGWDHTQEPDPGNAGVGRGTKSGKLVQASENQVYLSFYNERSQGSTAQGAVKTTGKRWDFLFGKWILQVFWCTARKIWCSSCRSFLLPLRTDYHNRKGCEYFWDLYSLKNLVADLYFEVFTFLVIELSRQSVSIFSI